MRDASPFPLTDCQSSKTRCLTLLRLSANFSLTISKPHMEVKTTEVKVCLHAEVMKDLCVECGVDLRGLRLEHSASVSVLHSVPELKVSVARARQLGKADQDRLLRDDIKKLVLLVDLDQTIIHTTNDNVPADLEGVHHFQLYGPNSPWYHTKFRPHTLEFLRNISKTYELHICTFGARKYAHTIADLINQLDPSVDAKLKHNFFADRILSRDECLDPTSKTGNLNALFPCGDSMVCIIDDREDVWNFSPNLIAVKPYHYFRNTGDINSPFKIQETSIYDENKDLLEASDKKKDDVKIDEESAPAETPATLSPPEESEKSAELSEVSEETGAGKADSGVTEENEAVNTDPEAAKEKEADSEVTEEKEVVKADSTEPLDTTEKVVNDADEGTAISNDAEEKAPEDTKKDVKEQTDADVDHDDYLLHLEEILQRIHTEFYNDYDQKKKHLTEGEQIALPDLKEIVPRVRRKVLHGVNIVFSGVIPTNIPAEKSKLYTVAKALGANVSNDVTFEGSPLERTTHVVASKHGTAKVNKALKSKKIWIVNPMWLYTCSERWDRVAEELYVLGKDDDFSAHSKRRSRLSPEQERFLSQPAAQRMTTAKGAASASEPTAVYDPRTGKRVRKDTAKPSSSSSPAEAPRLEPEAEVEVLPHQMVDFSPLSNFSMNDLDQMGKEVDDACSEGDEMSAENSSSSDDDAAPQQGALKRPREESSSEESMSSEFPKGWTSQDVALKRPRVRELEEDTRDSLLERDMGDSNSSGGSLDDDDDMAAELEREFLDSN